MIAVPLASPLGISPTGLCVNRSSSCACDMFNISGTVAAIGFLSFDGLKGFQVFDQRALVWIRQVRAEVMSFVLDEVGTFIRFEQVWNELVEFGSAFIARKL